ncbi:alpha-galactosidase [Leifsonia sp. AG29]|uniref:alpha-galactosidase n=1 Tax=Leifsonia sp. AG29 TaxID=2598860 RepID=UPI00131A9781|nr:glycoside hydrolase family 36 protein [Leifsonia sp. AG29]
MTPERTIRWGHRALTVEIAVASDGSVSLVSIETETPEGRYRVEGGATPLVEVRTEAEGADRSTGRVVDSLVGSRLRYRQHREETSGRRHDLSLELCDAERGILVTQHLSSFDGVRAVRSTVDVRNEGDEPTVLFAVSSAVLPVAWPREDVTLRHADDDWTAEFRWQSRPLAQVLPRAFQPGAKYFGLNASSIRSEGQWATRAHLPMGIIERSSGGAIAWEVESPAAWRWEIGELGPELFYIGLEGPTDVDGGWDYVLDPGDVFTTVSASYAVAAGDWQDAVAALTEHRRSSRTAHSAFLDAPVVYNDFLKALWGDPTADKLEPLIDSVAAAGADIFCIDAGWYDDESGGWWDTVGAWEPSRNRFPDGIELTLQRIRDAGMVPGLWVEPEVVGVRSPLANELPDGAFFLRRGRRIVEHGRYHLDFTHPAARAHATAVIDRLVDLGAGYFKFDYNIAGAHGTDSGDRSPGDGRLQHARAYLDWLEELLDRHPGLIIENCGSGGMRADAETLKHVQLQQSSDQDNTALVLPISAAGLTAIPPEQLAMWTYPDAGTSDSETRMALGTALIGRFHLSGAVSELSEQQQELLAAAVEAHKSVRSELVRSYPVWPVGLPGWSDDWIVVGLRMPSRLRVVVARRSGGIDTLNIPLGGGLVSPTISAPLGAEESDEWRWDEDRRTLTVRVAQSPGGLVLDLSLPPQLA